MKDDIKICRACTEETNGYISLYKPGKICGELIKLADVLNKCTSLNVSFFFMVKIHVKYALLDQFIDCSLCVCPSDTFN